MFKPGTYVRYALALPPGSPHQGRLELAQIVGPDDNAPGRVWIRLTAHLVLSVPHIPQRFCLLPNAMIPQAQAAVAVQALGHFEDAIVLLTSAGATVIAAAAPGLAGGAAMMSGLATIGGTAVGGIVIIAALPALSASVGVLKIINRNQNDEVAKDAATASVVAGSIAGSCIVVTAVAEAGAVAGLSGAGITSGLAALGGGAIIEGGAGIAGGLMVSGGLFAIPIALGIVGSLMFNAVRQDTLAQELQVFDNFWSSMGYV
ncbi:hypothetical protein C8F01DRAFT_448743 [Mycena amicta]|nr:hypothetical protein C8F01DRAFT_448743 [Mycena amicta]